MKSVHKKLEFDIICSRVADIASAEAVKEQILKTEPVNDLESAQKLLSQTADALRILASKRPCIDFDDIRSIISKAKAGATLSPAELLKVKKSISAFSSLKNCVESEEACDTLKDITAWVRVPSELEKKINDAVENDTDLKDNASDKLYSLRRAIVRANSKLRERLDGFTKRSDISKYLRDNIVTLRDGRYVVPVRSECRTSVKGLIHDVSATGATIFVEPFAIVEANNEIKTLRTEEQIEIERILAELSGVVAENYTILYDIQRVLTECGVIFAKAEYAKMTDSFMPIIDESGEISLIGARHPLIEPSSVVPVDIDLGSKRMLLISGPNTGGKTVALKIVGLFSLMAASGMFIPACDGSKITIFEKIYCDVGDSQSIEQSLSRFSAHMTNISHIIRGMNGRSLVLLDEVGDGTDPDEGAALAVAIIKRTLRSGATAIVTTHFNAVKKFALTSKDIVNACMQFDPINFRPTYKLLTGISGSSYALEIASRLGFDRDLIADARSELSADKVALDKIITEAEKMRNIAEKDKAAAEKAALSAAEDRLKAEKLKNEYDKKLADINENARAIIRRRADEYSDRAAAIIEEMKEQLKATDEAALFAARKTAAKLNEGVPADIKKPRRARTPALPEELLPGVSVYVSGLDKTGVIAERPRGKKAIVAIGAIKTEINIAALSVIFDEPEKQSYTPPEKRQEPIEKEIMMLGMTIAEATEELDRVLADIPSRSTLRIVHGKGTGALGKGIQAYLKRHNRIKSYRYGGYGEGDSGVTIVEIK